MRKLEFRAFICLFAAAVLFLGLLVFIWQFVSHGSDWATFYANKHIYSDGKLAVGNIYDVNGNVLEKNENGKITFNDDYWVRRGTVHAVGDRRGNIGTSAEQAFQSDIVGYNLLTGTYSMTGNGRDIKLTIDAEVSKVAAQALGDRSGLVGVYNYETGDIVCMVSGPNFDPADPPEFDPDDSSGMYLNKILSGRLIPGSIFKVVTSAAAIENLENLDSFSYYCGGSTIVAGEVLRDFAPHGQVDFHGALTHSCNGAFGKLAREIGPGKMKEYVDKLGLTKSYDIDGIRSVPGSFEFPENSEFNLSWAGIGQYNDQVNPLSMMVYMGAIAGGGQAAMPRLLYSPLRTPKMTDQMIRPETATELTDMMKETVTQSYGEDKFPGLDLYGKTGTAEITGHGNNGWFTGFIKDPGKPYAFIVCIENGGLGITDAVPIANTVMQALVSR
ncbi:MAG: penicillin-binding transpeptidase domain-containing protein [Peptostreptococcaceae bacterium]|nr:penicillin-binding transpeptidase domain-containing protein [Peptostreptococcaceae bacterium]MDY5739371.1 penicillin-binding transpeptidase domain-containing protein [Anaerovoracaceae bacterium]